MRAIPCVLICSDSPSGGESERALEKTGSAAFSMQAKKKAQLT